MSQKDSANVVTTREAIKILAMAIKANIPVSMRSAPGLGKSSIARVVSDMLDFEYVDIRMLGMLPEDVNGAMVVLDGVPQMAPIANLFPLETTPLPAGKKGFFLHLEEFYSAPEEVVTAMFRVVLDRETGLGQKLHPSTVIMLSGNRPEDQVHVSAPNSAMDNRVLMLTLKTHAPTWLEDFAYPNDLHPFTTGLISMKPDVLNDFKPDGSSKPFCSERSWERVSDFLIANDINSPSAIKDPLIIKALSGIISSTAVYELSAFAQVFGQITKLQDILANPSGAPIPTQHQMLYAMSTMLSTAIDESNYKQVLEYVNRLKANQATFWQIALQMIVMRNHSWITSKPEIRTMIVQNNRELTELFARIDQQ